MAKKKLYRVKITTRAGIAIDTTKRYEAEVYTTNRTLALLETVRKFGGEMGRGHAIVQYEVWP